MEPGVGHVYSFRGGERTMTFLVLRVNAELVDGLMLEDSIEGDPGWDDHKFAGLVSWPARYLDSPAWERIA